jgi:decaprenyl-phosphate phosphoribosyltransferase
LNRFATLYDRRNIDLKVYPKGMRPSKSAGESEALKPAFPNGKIAMVLPFGWPTLGRLSTSNSIVKDHIRLLRPHQWVKNIFVLIPAFFGGKLGVLFASYKPTLAFLSFCAAASSVYILNDIFDLEKDRIHERKRSRPLSSGAVSIRNAAVLLAVLGGISAVLALNVGAAFSYVVAGYFALNLLYSIYFKHISIVDISFIASGFVLRVLAGGFATDVVISKWLILMTFLLACCLAVGKRRDDLLMAVDKTALRPANSGYTLKFIDTCLVILGSITIVCYVMYTVSDEVVRRLNSDNVYLTSVFVVIGILRFLQIAIVEQKSGSPTMILLKDSLIQAMIALWFLAFLVLLYIAR